MSAEQHALCFGCKALDRLEWTCALGHKVLAGKLFRPAEPCPKPTTDEEYSAAAQHYPKDQADDLSSPKS